VQVRQEFLRRSQELPHETLSTILADSGRHPMSNRVTAAYHPNPIHKIDLELPPSAAEIRRSAQWPFTAAQCGAVKCCQTSEQQAGPVAASRAEVSAVEVLEHLLQQGHKPPGSFSHAAACAGAATADGPGLEVPDHGTAAAAALGTQLPPSWLGNGLMKNSAVHVRGSMLASESTFIFPAGIPASASGTVDADDAEMATADVLNSEGDELTDATEAALQLGTSSNIHAEEGIGAGAGWGLWQHQQPALWQQLPKAPRQTSSAPAGSSQGKSLRSAAIAGYHDMASLGECCCLEAVMMVLLLCCVGWAHVGNLHSIANAAHPS
jgi:hypothetical protein